MISRARYIDEVINRVWIEDIRADYKNKYLLMEDSLKNAFYYHLRKRLGDNFLLANNVRIFTEYHHHGKKADLAVVEINREKSEEGYLGDSIHNVYAIIEFKFKNSTSDQHFIEDVKKVLEYIKKDTSNLCRYYLAFIQEVYFEEAAEFTWTSLIKNKIPHGRITELQCFRCDPEPRWVNKEL
ncbi:MAG: hypothetical protein U9N81_04285 [Bacillota bacterium]|nr:hypothetical protein [Bacillota bacterium]MEA1960499.1 hypothetical protein [Bacillota bacterium]